MKKNFLIAFLVLICFSNVSAQWTSLNSGTLSFIQSVNFPVNDTGYYATDNNVIEKTTDGGVTWNQIGPSIAIGRTYFLTSSKGFGYWGPRLYKTTYGGVSWTRMIMDSLDFVPCVEFPSAQIGYCTAINPTYDSLRTYKTTDGGNTWLLVSRLFNLGGGAYYDISFTSVNTGYLSSDAGIIYKTTNSGSNWILQTNTGMLWGAIDFPAVDTGYVVGTDLYKTVNGGVTWTQVPNPFPSIEYWIKFFDTKTGFVCGGDGFNQGFIYKTINGGQTWTISNSNVNTYQQMSFVSVNEGYACGLNGLLMKYNGITGEFDASTSPSMRYDVFPNPSNGKFDLSCSEIVSRIDIYSIIGENVYSSEKIMSKSNIDILNKPPGIYLVKAETISGHQFTKRIIIE